MPVHIDEMVSEVTVVEGDLPLSEAQLDKLVMKVLQRLSEKQQEQAQAREATALRSSAMPRLSIEG